METEHPQSFPCRSPEAIRPLPVHVDPFPSWRSGSDGTRRQSHYTWKSRPHLSFALRLRDLLSTLRTADNSRNDPNPRSGYDPDAKQDVSPKWPLASPLQPASDMKRIFDFGSPRTIGLCHPSMHVQDVLVSMRRHGAPGHL